MDGDQGGTEGADVGVERGDNTEVGRSQGTNVRSVRVDGVIEQVAHPGGQGSSLFGRGDTITGVTDREPDDSAEQNVGLGDLTAGGGGM
jgi:hypothetical protein